ncbi:hypothetical protein [Phyllobacterium myrsinacearum]|uniref:Uncharacterized protein n=1 Tax=Phyllobacterium myrsinacearum TaxID=28101 RepID=A0A2S9JA69_9HYPH|nr:hypothetical protein [Phyllobacterium myrsinacearum]PRD49673.1 hypothetical protein C5750_24950 [Phyllobacterium myrsinacearum]PWV94743.1 hypothetical protein DEV92_102196 [Phyllobacterium myrsinacearum]RZV07148.1 hypothetical protein EV654_1817 [Phyllobacterium myrsinacearum]
MTLTLDQTPDLSQRRWRRRSLWALVLLVPLALFVMSYSDVREMGKSGNFLPVDVAAGQSARYGGSDWQFIELRTVSEGIKPGSLPQNAVPVIARFIVEIGDPDLKNLWLMCSVRLVDASGRSWSPAAVPGLPRPAEGIETCTSTIFAGVSQGTRRVVEETYLVPANVVGELRPTIGMRSERPYYLRFARPE